MRRRSFGLWAWMLGAMLLAQSLGLMHTMVHAAAVRHVEHQDGGSHAEQHGRTGAGWLDLLFATHDDESDCRLFDQVSRGDCLPAQAQPCVPTQGAADPGATRKASYPLAPAAFAQARGPPSVR